MSKGQGGTRVGFLNLFDSCSKSELELAKQTVRMFSIASKTSFISLLEVIPGLEVIARNNRLDKYDYYCTCACIMFVMFASERSEKEALKRAMEDWCKGSFSDVIDLANFINYRKPSSLESMAPYIGYWIIQKIASDPSDNPQIKALSNYRSIQNSLGSFIIAQVQHSG